jgi:hypothetical protein
MWLVVLPSDGFWGGTLGARSICFSDLAKPQALLTSMAVFFPAPVFLKGHL